MHSSRMRTPHLLPASPSMHCSGRGCLPGGSAPEGSVCTGGGVSAPGGGGGVCSYGGVSDTPGCVCPDIPPGQNS